MSDAKSRRGAQPAPQSQSSCPTADSAVALRVLKMAVKPGRLTVELAVHPDAPRTTNPQIIEQVMALCPTIAQHSCINDQHLDAGCFGAVMNCTSLPHLLEHMVVDLQAQQALGRAVQKSADHAAHAQGGACANSGSLALADGLAQVDGLAQSLPDVALVGSTEWIDEAAGLVRVSVSFFDDLVALRALKEALQFLNAAVAL